MPPDGVALVSRDQELVAGVRRLCAAAGQELEVVAQQADIRALRRRAAAVLVDAASPDVAGTAAEHADGVSKGSAEVIVLTTSPEALDPWRTAVRVGARQVLTLPEDSRRLVDALALAREGAEPSGRLLCVVGGSGGLGASSLAAALAWAASTSGSRATLVDLDPVGGGADLLLGLERAEGLRWPDLSEARGVVPAGALYERLPLAGQVAVVACGRVSAGTAAGVPPLAAASVVAAARRGMGAVVADLPRWQTEAADAVIGASDVVLAVVAAEVRGVAAAAVTIDRVASLCDDIHVVLRTRQHGRLGAAQISDCLRRPIAATLTVDARVAAAAERGELLASLRRSQLGSVAKDLWARFGVGDDDGA
jgi:secretion/DNA translocation related CpaE-like protein